MDLSPEIKSRYKLSTPTLKSLSSICPKPSRCDVLKLACKATEFQAYSIKSAERGFFREVNEQRAIPYPLTEPATQPWHKAFLLVQLQLLSRPWPNRLPATARKSLIQEQRQILRVMDIVLRCVTDTLGERQDGKGVRTALDVLRSVKAGIWEGSDNELLQVDGIGLKRMERLVAADIKKIRQLSKLEFHHIERLLSRNPPYGHDILHKVSGFPDLEMEFNIVGPHTNEEPNKPSSSLSGMHFWKAIVNLSFKNQQLPTWKNHTPWTTLVVEGGDGRLVWFWRGSVKRLVGGKDMFLGLEVREGEELKISFACESIVGTILRQTVQVLESHLAS